MHKPRQVLRRQKSSLLAMLLLFLDHQYSTIRPNLLLSSMARQVFRRLERRRLINSRKVFFRDILLVLAWHPSSIARVPVFIPTKLVLVFCSVFLEPVHDGLEVLGDSFGIHIASAGRIVFIAEEVFEGGFPGLGLTSFEEVLHDSAGFFGVEEVAFVEWFLEYFWVLINFYFFTSGSVSTYSPASRHIFS